MICLLFSGGKIENHAVHLEVGIPKEVLLDSFKEGVPANDPLFSGFPMKKQKLSPIETVFGIAIDDAQTRFDELTAREREVAQLMASGEKNATIAKQLGISPKTLDIQRNNAVRKFKARGPVDVARVVFAVSTGK